MSPQGGILPFRCERWIWRSAAAELSALPSSGAGSASAEWCTVMRFQPPRFLIMRAGRAGNAPHFARAITGTPSAMRGWPSCASSRSARASASCARCCWPSVRALVVRDLLQRRARVARARSEERVLRGIAVALDLVLHRVEPREAELELGFDLPESAPAGILLAEPHLDLVDALVAVGFLDPGGQHLAPVDLRARQRGRRRAHGLGATAGGAGDREETEDERRGAQQAGVHGRMGYRSRKRETMGPQQSYRKLAWLGAGPRGRILVHEESPGADPRRRTRARPAALGPGPQARLG